jgi:integrase
MPSASKRSNRSWTARWRDKDGKTVQLAGFPNEKAALDYAKNQEFYVRQGKRTNPSDMRITLDEFCREVWRPTLDVRKSTREDYQRALRSHILPKFGSMPIGEIKKHNLQSWAVELKNDKGLSPRTVEKLLNLLAAILKVAVENEYLYKNPFNGWNRGKANKLNKVTPLTKDQVEAITRNLAAQYRIMVWIGYWTGMRPSEILGLTWEQLDFEDGKIVVDRQISRDINQIHEKSGLKTQSSEREVPFPKILQGLIREHVHLFGLGPAGLIMKNRVGGVLRYKDAARLFRFAARPIGLKNGEGMHQLRHTFVSTCITLGISIKEIQAYVGHASITETMDTYGHLFPDSLSKANNQLDLYAEEQEQYVSLDVIAGGSSNLASRGK